MSDDTETLTFNATLGVVGLLGLFFAILAVLLVVHGLHSGWLR